MTVKNFCKEYGLKYQTVYKKIAHHKNKELAGHITKAKGESVDLDDFAVDFLTPFNVKVVKAMEECQAVVLENDELKDKIEAAEFNLEQAEGKFLMADSENEKLTAEIAELKAILSDKSKNITELKEQLEVQNEAYRQKVSELEGIADKLEIHIAELTEENGTIKAQLDAVPKFFRKNQ